MIVPRLTVTVDTFSPALRRLSVQAPKQLSKAIRDYAFATQRESVRLMRASKPSGRTYARGKKFHTASAPGQPPARDTGQLISHIFFEATNHYADVGTDVLHGLYLENGTVRMDARPWLIPALEATEATLVRELDEVFQL